MMKVHKFNPYPNQLFDTVDKCAHKLMRLWRHCVDQFLSCFFPTTQELKQPQVYLLKCLVALPLYLFLSLVTLPPGMLGLLLWIPICWRRTRYRVSVSDINSEAQQYIRDNCQYASYSQTCQTKFKTTIQHGKIPETFSVATLNVCFLQEFLSRYNNLCNMMYRAETIGRRLLENQIKYVDQGKDVTHENGVCHEDLQSQRESNDCEMSKRHFHQVSVNGEEHKLDVTVLPEFPDTDFLVFQETWDLRLAEVLNWHLHSIYPYIIYDVGEDGWVANGYCNNSGLTIASKWPIAYVRFSRFEHNYLHDHYSSKGLLQVKVSCTQ